MIKRDWDKTKMRTKYLARNKNIKSTFVSNSSLYFNNILTFRSAKDFYFIFKVPYSKERFEVVPSVDIS